MRTIVGLLLIVCLFFFNVSTACALRDFHDETREKYVPKHLIKAGLLLILVAGGLLILG